jgi:hypothetical protein
MFSLIKRMKGPHQMSEPTKRADPLAEMKAAIDRACAAAEDAGILPRDITPYVEGLLTYWRQRALHVADQANATRMHDCHGHLIDHAGNVARARAIRQEQERVASEREWQESVNRRAEAQAERDGFIR